MKYRNLNLSFSLETVTFSVNSISLETFLVPIPRHSHSRNSYELHYISSGYGKLITDETTYEIGPGAFFVTGPGVFHEQISREDDPMTEYGVYLQVKGRAGRRKDTPSAQFLSRDFWFGEASSDLSLLMRQTVDEAEHRRFGYECLLAALLQQLIVSIARHYQRSLLEPEASGPSASPVPAEQIYLTIEEAFLYNYRDLTLDKLADSVHLGVRQTERLLKKYYGKTFLQKKTEARMSAACLLLQDSAQSIASVSEWLGYSSAEHFTNAFKKFYQLSPAAYRRKH